MTDARRDHIQKQLQEIDAWRAVGVICFKASRCTTPPTLNRRSHLLKRLLRHWLGRGVFHASYPFFCILTQLITSASFHSVGFSQPCSILHHRRGLCFPAFASKGARTHFPFHSKKVHLLKLAAKLQPLVVPKDDALPLSPLTSNGTSVAGSVSDPAWCTQFDPVPATL